MDSNQQPLDYSPNAFPTELRKQLGRVGRKLLLVLYSAIVSYKVTYISVATQSQLGIIYNIGDILQFGRSSLNRENYYAPVFYNDIWFELFLVGRLSIIVVSYRVVVHKCGTLPCIVFVCCSSAWCVNKHFILLDSISLFQIGVAAANSNLRFTRTKEAVCIQSVVKRSAKLYWRSDIMWHWLTRGQRGSV